MLTLYNTLSRTIEPLAPEPDGVIRMYSCGPTVYNHAHIGNLRSFIMADVLYRTLRANGHEISWVMNLTDIDDKTIKGAIEKFGNAATVENLREYTQTFTDAFMEDLRKVNVSIDAIKFIKVTDVIPQIQEFILELIKKGYAYTTEDGSTYFSIEKYQADFGDYGALVGEKFLEGKKIGARVQVDEYDKDNMSDFALWKAYIPEDAHIFWDHPALGKGRPGWHIECSVINRVAFGGKPIDVHTGGVDLKFPHHTNEIAQSQPLGPFVKHWFHIEHLLVDNKKMSKSANNFYTLRDIEAKGFSDLDLRYTYLQSHYQTQQNFTWESLEASRNARVKLQNRTSTDVTEINSEFLTALNDDLNTAQALAAVWEHTDGLSAHDTVLGLKLGEQQEFTIPEEVQKLLNERQAARDAKDFTKSDELRNKIAELGFEVSDTSDGQKVNKE